MKKMWNNYLKDAVILYCVIYTFTTIVNSIVYLCDGIYEDPNGNWHELDRAVVVLIGVLAYEFIKYIPIKKKHFENYCCLCFYIIADTCICCSDRT